MSLRGGIGLPELPLEDGQEFRLGIMGGTFDPIHYGHLVTAEQARESLDLDAVLFMPAGTPAFKLDKPVTPAEDRYAMTVLATAANPAFLASRFEIDRPGVTYTADTLHALRDFYPPQVKLYFITGADAIIDIVTWHDAERIAELATFIAATRPGFDIDTARARIKETIDGGMNAAILAAKMLAMSDPELLEKLKAYSAEMKDTVQAKADRLAEVGYEEYLNNK